MTGEHCGCIPCILRKTVNCYYCCCYCCKTFLGRFLCIFRFSEHTKKTTLDKSHLHTRTSQTPSNFFARSQWCHRYRTLIISSINIWCYWGTYSQYQWLSHSLLTMVESLTTSANHWPTNNPVAYRVLHYRGIKTRVLQNTLSDGIATISGALQCILCLLYTSPSPRD